VKRLRFALLAVASSLLLGGVCMDNADPVATVYFQFPDDAILELNEIVQVQVMVQTLGPELQAIALSVKGDPSTSVLFQTAPNPAFDDDGQLFVPPQFDFVAGEVNGIVDLRHGLGNLSGTFAIATLWLRAINDGQSTLRFTGIRLADEKGQDFAITALDHPFEVIR